MNVPEQILFLQSRHCSRIAARAHRVQQDPKVLYAARSSFNCAAGARVLAHAAASPLQARR
jgi:hypothetical protein